MVYNILFFIKQIKYYKIVLYSVKVTHGNCGSIPHARNLLQDGWVKNVIQ